MNGTRGIVFKRCGCTDEKTGRQLAGRCPQLAEPGHGSWYLPPIRLHDLRHGAATLALASHTDLKVIQQMLGHSSIVTTADTYTKSRELHQPGEKLQVGRSAGHRIAGTAFRPSRCQPCDRGRPGVDPV